MEKNSTSNEENEKHKSVSHIENSYKIPFNVPLLTEIRKIDKDYYAQKLEYIFDEVQFDTDKSIKLGQAMYETSGEIQTMHYQNLLTIFGIFAEICHVRYDMDVTLKEFFRIQKVVKEQSDKFKQQTNGKKTGFIQ